MNIVKKWFSFGSKDQKENAARSPSAFTPEDLVAVALGKQTSKPSNSISGNQVNDYISGLEYGDTLINIANADSKYTTAAQKNLAHKLDAGQLEITQLAQDIPQLHKQLSITGRCQTQAFSTTLLEAPAHAEKKEDELVALCEESANPNVRASLIEKISDTSHLKQLEKHFKGRDKTSYKKVKQKLDDIKKTENTHKALEQKIQTLLADIEAQSKRPYNKDYKFKAESLERKYNALKNSISDTEQEQAEAFISACYNVILEAEAQLASEYESSQSPAINKHEEANENSNQVTEHSSSAQKRIDQLLIEGKHLFSENEPEHTASSNLKASLNEHTEVLIEEQKSGVIDKKEAKQFYDIKVAIEHLISKLESDSEFKESALFLRNLHIPNSDLSDSDADTSQLHHHLSVVEDTLKPFSKKSRLKANMENTVLLGNYLNGKQRITDIEEQEKEDNRHISALIRSAQSATKNGQMKRAMGIRYSIEEKLQSKTVIPSYIQRHWEELEQSIERMRDWQNYAITPKLESLVNKMKDLAESPKKPELQATQIQKLQQQWKEVSKGSGKTHEELWNTFKSFSDTAYETCKTHYDKLDAERTENTQKRANLIEQLRDYNQHYDWEKADWSQVETLLHSAKKEWQGYSPTLKAKQKEQQAAFDEQVSPIQTRLYNWFDKNKAEKERLINGLAPLVKSDDIDQAVSVAIQFQKQWKTIGRCHRRDENALWKQFREHCDGIFEKRNAQRDQERAVVDARIKEAEAILTSINTLLNHDTDTFDQALKDLDELKNQFMAVQELPKPVQTALEKKYRHTISAIEKRSQTLHSERRSETWQQCFNVKAQLMTEDDTLDHNSIIDSLGSNSTQKKHLKNSLNINENDIKAVEKQYRLLCVRADILADQESPSEDKALRMEYQVSQLQAGLGQSKDSAEKLAELWLAESALPFPEYPALQKRFLSQCALF